MNYALLAATALGAIGLYLMLPRERAPLVRLGGLLGAMALAGLFLFLAQAANGAMARIIPGERPPIYFYLFAAIMIGGAIGVICQPRPVYAALYFVLVTLAGAGIFVLLMAEFMAIVLIIIYAGAILVTYVFVIMLASQGSVGGSVVAPAYDRRASSGLIAVTVGFCLIGAVLQALLPVEGHPLATPVAVTQRDPLMAESMGIDFVTQKDLPERSSTQPAFPTNVQVVGASLYSRYSLSLELAGMLLTIALVGAVIIARKNTSDVETLGSGQLPTE